MSISMSSDDRLIVTGSRDKLIHLWDVATGKKMKTLRAHERAVTMVEFVTQHREIVSASLDGSLIFWDLYGGSKEKIDVGRGPVIKGALSANGQFALLGLRNGELVLWDMKSRTEVKMLTTAEGTIRNIAFSRDNSVAIVAVGNGDIMIWDVPHFGNVQTMHIDDLHTAGVSPDGESIITGLRSGELRLLHIADGQEKMKFQALKSSVVTNVVFSQDGNYLYSTSRHGSLNIWEVATGRRIGNFTEHEKGITALDIGSKGNLVLTGGRDKKFNLWNFDTPQQYKNFQNVIDDMFHKFNVNQANQHDLTVIANWYAYRGLPDWAIEFLTKAKEAGASDVNLNLARCYWLKGNHQAAISNFNDVLQEKQCPEDYVKLCLQALRKRQ